MMKYGKRFHLRAHGEVPKHRWRRGAERCRKQVHPACLDDYR